MAIRPHDELNGIHGWIDKRHTSSNVQVSAHKFKCTVAPAFNLGAYFNCMYYVYKDKDTKNHTSFRISPSGNLKRQSSGFRYAKANLDPLFQCSAVHYAYR